jgi:hypothetical protein
MGLVSKLKWCTISMVLLFAWEYLRAASDDTVEDVAVRVGVFVAAHVGLLAFAALFWIVMWRLFLHKVPFFTSLVSAFSPQRASPKREPSGQK